MIRFIEELSLNAWPALQTTCYDGWLLRFADGYTRRANSINPLYPSKIDPLEKIRQCERVYSSRSQPSVFKLTPAAEPETLDALLAEEGYMKDAPTSVQVASLETVSPPTLGNVLIERHLTDRWLQNYCRLNSVANRDIRAMTCLLSNIVPARAFFALRQNTEVVAVGLAVMERDYMGLFDIVSAANCRNQGLGRRLVMQMLRWGQEEGAKHAYLQVMHNNAPALHLYRTFGFREIYAYWYRVKQPSLAI